MNWEIFRDELTRVCQKEDYEKGGRPPIDVIVKFKASVLKRIYNLSYDQTEYQINDRLSFMRFLGLGLNDKVLDAKTIWDFENTLANAEMGEILFKMFDEVLESEGLITHKGTIVDATFVDAPRQRNSRDENAKIKNGEIPEEWELKNLRLLIQDNKNISYGVLKPGDYTENGVPMIRIVDIKDNKLNINEVYKITDELDEQYKKTRLEGNEILISLVGTIGRVATTESNHKGMNVHRNIGVIPIDKKKANKYYICYSLSTALMQKIIDKKTIGGNQPLLNLEDVRELKIIYPPINEQEKIASILLAIDEKIKEYDNKKQKLEQLKKGLMQQLLTGKIRVINKENI